MQNKVDRFMQNMAVNLNNIISLTKCSLLVGAHSPHSPVNCLLCLPCHRLRISCSARLPWARIRLCWKLRHSPPLSQHWSGTPVKSHCSWLLINHFLIPDKKWNKKGLQTYSTSVWYFTVTEVIVVVAGEPRGGRQGGNALLGNQGGGYCCHVSVFCFNFLCWNISDSEIHRFTVQVSVHILKFTVKQFLCVF